MGWSNNRKISCARAAEPMPGKTEATAGCASGKRKAAAASGTPCSFAAPDQVFVKRIDVFVNRHHLFDRVARE